MEELRIITTDRTFALPGVYQKGMNVMSTSGVVAIHTILEHAGIQEWLMGELLTGDHDGKMIVINLRDKRPAIVTG